MELVNGLEESLFHGRCPADQRAKMQSYHIAIALRERQLVKSCNYLRVISKGQRQERPHFASRGIERVLFLEFGDDEVCNVIILWECLYQGDLRGLIVHQVRVM